VSVIVLGGSGDVLGGVASIGVPIAALLGGRCGDPRRVAGPGQVALVPSALMGSAVVLASELIARRILAPTELPVGIVTSIIGAPYLLYLLWTANTIRRSG
jgi:iron complex transport system permease protein